MLYYIKFLCDFVIPLVIVWFESKTFIQLQTLALKTPYIVLNINLEYSKVMLFGQIRAKMELVEFRKFLAEILKFLSGNTESSFFHVW